mgnify:CR=1 FL=1
MPTSKTIPLRRAGRIAPQQMFSNADPWARIRPRAFVSVPGVTPVTLAPSRRAAGLRGLATPKVPQACCGSLWGATRHGACRSPPTIRRRFGAPQAPALGVRSRGFASGAVWGRERRTPQGAPTLSLLVGFLMCFVDFLMIFKVFGKRNKKFSSCFGFLPSLLVSLCLWLLPGPECFPRVAKFQWFTKELPRFPGFSPC